MAEPIDRRRIDPVDAQLNGAADCANGRIVILLAPAEKPASSADGPGTQAYGGDFNSASSERSSPGRHIFSLFSAGYFGTFCLLMIWGQSFDCGLPHVVI
jgi:hypothetical protein